MSSVISARDLGSYPEGKFCKKYFFLYIHLMNFRKFKNKFIINFGISSYLQLKFAHIYCLSPLNNNLLGKAVLFNEHN